MMLMLWGILLASMIRAQAKHGLRPVRKPCGRLKSYYRDYLITTLHHMKVMPSFPAAIPPMIQGNRPCLLQIEMIELTGK